MNRRTIILSLGAVALGGCAAPTTGVRIPPDTTIYVVRHGEKDGDALTRAGVARAEALAVALADVPLDRVYSTSYARNVATAEPVVAAQGIALQTLPDFDVAPALVAGNAGKTVLWVGNKGNIAPIWEAFGLPDPAPLAYGDLGIVRADAAGRVTAELRRFGA